MPSSANKGGSVFRCTAVRCRERARTVSANKVNVYEKVDFKTNFLFLQRFPTSFIRSLLFQIVVIVADDKIVFRVVKFLCLLML